MKGGNLIWQPFKAIIANPDYSLYLIQSNLIYFQVGPTHGSMESKAYTAVELEVIKAWLVKITTIGNVNIYISRTNWKSLDSCVVLNDLNKFAWSSVCQDECSKLSGRKRSTRLDDDFFAKCAFSQPTVLISSNQSTRESVITLQIVIVIVVNYKNQVIVLVVNHKNQVLIIILKSSDSIIQKQSDSP